MGLITDADDALIQAAAATTKRCRDLNKIPLSDGEEAHLVDLFRAAAAGWVERIVGARTAPLPQSAFACEGEGCTAYRPPDRLWYVPSQSGWLCGYCIQGLEKSCALHQVEQLRRLDDELRERGTL